MHDKKLSYRTIVLFWLPLAATWLMMAAEGPFLASIIARLTDPKINLAAYGVAFSLALIVEAPIIMIMSASTALVKDWPSFNKLRMFTLYANLFITGVMIVGLIPDVFYFIGNQLIGLPAHVTRLTHISCLIFLPWPAAIGYRRFYQGVLIRFHQTRRVAYGTAVRLGSMATFALFFYSLGLPGAIVGAAALSLGVMAEALAIRLMAAGTIKKLRQLTVSSSSSGIKPSLGYKKIFTFYYPLAITSLLALGVHPLVTFFLGKSRLSIESLAVLPVINSLVFIFRSIGLSYQEVGIALFGRGRVSDRKLRNFAVFLVVGVLSGLSLIVFTPMLKFWFVNLSGLNETLAQFAYLPVQIMVILPVTSVILSYQRGVLVFAHQTKPITVSSSLEIALICVFLYVAVVKLRMVGATAAALAYVLGRMTSVLYLLPRVHRIQKIRMKGAKK